MSMYNCLKNSQGINSNFSSPSNAIDQMISLAIFDYGEMKKVISSNERTDSYNRFVF